MTPMSHREITREEPWKRELSAAVRTLPALLDALALSSEMVDGLEDSEFPLLVPPSYIRRIRRGDPQDPLLRQVLPSQAERINPGGFSPDPLGEAALSGGDGLIEKYSGRVLLIATGACPIHCRYCFRRHYDYHGNLASREGFRAALEAIEQSANSEEVILSGGDPLCLDDRKLGDLLSALDELPSVRRIRIHTRFPVAIPSRLNSQLVKRLASMVTPTAFVVHVNHANEIDSELEAALLDLRPAVTALLNQSVLLRGINDSTDTLAELSRALFRAGVLPYYLHQLDPVKGASHFEVDPADALALHAELQAQLPGYLVPRLVREEPGSPGKTLLLTHPPSPKRDTR